MKTLIGKSIEQAVAFLESGKLVAIPTETVYGLAANGLNPSAVADIFKAKKRPSFDSRNYGFEKLTLLIKSIDKFEVDPRVNSKNRHKLIFVKNKENPKSKRKKR